MRMKTPLEYLAIAVLCVIWGPAGCNKPGVATTVARAEAVEDWRGITPLTRSADVFFGGQPSEAALRTASDHGVTTVVNLRSAAEMNQSVALDEATLVEDLGMEYVSIPITRQSFSVADAQRLDAALRAASGRVLIHCASSNRVGALWAVYLHSHRGMALTEAMEHGRRAGMRPGAEAMVTDAVGRTE